MKTQCLPAVAIASALASLSGNVMATAFPDTVFTNGFEPCTNLECAQVVCPGNGATTVSGIVYMPNGTLPLPNVEIYVPNSTPAALPGSGQYASCNEAPSGNPVAATLSGADGTFVLRNVPVGTNVPLVLLAGKWRRQVVIPSVTACTNTTLDASITRLPRSQAEGDLPLLAVATGNADAAECLVRKMGVNDSEFGIGGSTQRFQLFTANGADRFDAAHGGALFKAASTELWSSVENLSAYDEVLLACEGQENAQTKPQSALDAMRAYVNGGGRVYLGHYQGVWLRGTSLGAAEPEWVSLASWNTSLPTPSSLSVVADTSHSPGQTFSLWLQATGALSNSTLPVINPKHTLLSVDSALARRMLYAPNNVDGQPSVQYFETTLPVDGGLSDQRGRLAFSDLHPVADQSQPGHGFPSGGCVSAVTEITPQEKALLYAFFDLQRCVGASRD